MFCLRVGLLGWSKFLSRQSSLLKEGNIGFKERDGLKKRYDISPGGKPGY